MSVLPRIPAESRTPVPHRAEDRDGIKRRGAGPKNRARHATRASVAPVRHDAWMPRRTQLDIVLASPARAGALGGNGTSASRWRRLWTELGHRVRVTRKLEAPRADVLVALHATKCAAAIDAWKRGERGPLIVVLSGTDIHGRAQARLRRSLDLADRVVALQPRALDGLADAIRAKSVTILQSCPDIPRLRARADRFEIAVVAGLRAVKDPLRPARAVAGIAAPSRLRVTHIGPALDERLAARARELSGDIERYEWQGPRPRSAAQRLLARARALCVPSLSEGGANVLTEAIAARCPILCSAIPGNLGILGEDWPGVFPARDTRALRALLLRFEGDADLRHDLIARTHALRARVRPAIEKRAWRHLFDEIQRA